jgi:preprotein translocase subunit YajC
MIGAIVLMFVFSSRSQKKRDKEVNDMRNSLRIGDEVTTTGGIIGRVVSVKEETVVIETSRDGTKIRFLKSAIARVDVTAEDANAATKQENK